MDIRKIKQGFQIQSGLRLVWEAKKTWVIYSLGLAILVSLIPVLAIYLQKLFFDSFAEGMETGTGMPPEVLFWLIFSMAIVQILGAGLRSTSAYITSAQAQKVQDFVIEAFIASLSNWIYLFMRHRRTLIVYMLLRPRLLTELRDLSKYFPL